MINLISNVVVNVTSKWKEKTVLHLVLLGFVFNLFGLGKLLSFLQNNFLYYRQYTFNT